MLHTMAYGLGDGGREVQPFGIMDGTGPGKAGGVDEIEEPYATEISSAFTAQVHIKARATNFSAGFLAIDSRDLTGVKYLRLWSHTAQSLRGSDRLYEKLWLFLMRCERGHLPKFSWSWKGRVTACGHENSRPSSNLWQATQIQMTADFRLETLGPRYKARDAERHRRAGVLTWKSAEAGKEKDGNAYRRAHISQRMRCAPFKFRRRFALCRTHGRTHCAKGMAAVLG